MSRSDAYIRVNCDFCNFYEQEVELTAIARGGYDERDVARTLRRDGWRIIDEKEMCPNCAEETALAAED